MMTNNIEPLVSICIPTFNSGRYLRRMLDSIVNQTYQNVEVIILDNASNDDTINICHEFSGKHGFKVHRNDTNRGSGESFNRLIDYARGNLVAIYHSDDVYAPTMVAECVSAFASNSEVGIVGTLGHEIDSYGRAIGDFRFPAELRKLNRSTFAFEEIFVSILSYEGVFLITSSIMVQRSIYTELGKFDLQHFGSAGDYEMWFRIMQKYRFALINQPLISYRRHDMQGSFKEVKMMVGKPDALLVYDKYLATNPELFKPFFDHAYYKLMYVQAIKLNNIKEFRKSDELLLDIRNKIRGHRVMIHFLGILNLLKIVFPLSGPVRIKALLRSAGLVR